MGFMTKLFSFCGIDSRSHTTEASNDTSCSDQSRLQAENDLQQGPVMASGLGSNSCSLNLSIATALLLVISDED